MMKKIKYLIVSVLLVLSCLSLCSCRELDIARYTTAVFSGEETIELRDVTYKKLPSNKYIFLIFVNILLFLVGMFMETNAAVLLMSPLLYPTAIAMGIDPIHFGIILVTNIEIGLITPPMAANIYVSARINRSNLVEMWPYIRKFLLVSILVLLLITYVEPISLWWKMI